MKWPFEGRIEPAHAWGVVAIGTAGLIAMPTVLATLHAADPHFRWWWPTNWMALPAAIFLIGLALAAVPLSRPGRPATLAVDMTGGNAGTVGRGDKAHEPAGSAHAPGSARSVREQLAGSGGSAGPDLPAAYEPRPLVQRATASAGHVFLSAAAVDGRPADQLQLDLEAAGIRVWRDVTDLAPGDEQPVAIRRAITEGALVFLACFSSCSSAQARSYLNVQLLFAVEELRMRRPGVPWLIPVRFDNCLLPDIDLGGGRQLNALTPADVFDGQRDAQVQRLITAIRRIID